MSGRDYKPPSPGSIATSTLAARRTIAISVRGLIDALATADLSDATAEELIARLGEARALLERAPVVPGYIRRIEGALRGGGPYAELGPFTGDLHSISPLVQIDETDGVVTARATYGAGCEGAPGIVHGGYLASTMDELMAHVQRGAMRMTVALDMAYVAPSKLHRELIYRAWIDRVEGRKAFVAGTVHDGDTLCAKAKAVFVAIPPGMLAPAHFC